MRVEQWTDVVTSHGEGPVWWADQSLRLVDMLAGEFVVIADGLVQERTRVGSIAAMVRPTTDGHTLVARERDVVVLDSQHRSVRSITLPIPDGVRLNEGCCTPEGDLLVGSMAYGQTPGAGSLYRVTPSGTVELALGAVTVSNGIGFTRDGSRCYYVDSAAARVDLLTFDNAGAVVERRVFATVSDGVPDGLVVDSEDGVFVAIWGGARIDHFDRHGRRDGVIPLPVSQPTACTLGGEDGSTLYISTSRFGLADSDAGRAGAVFRCTVDAQPARRELFGSASPGGDAAA